MLTVFNRDKHQRSIRCCMPQHARRGPAVSLKSLDTADKEQFRPTGCRRQFPGEVETLYQAYYSQKAAQYSRRATAMWLVVIVVIFFAEVSQMHDIADHFETVILATRGIAILTLVAHLVWSGLCNNESFVKWNPPVTFLVWLVQFSAHVGMTSSFHDLKTDLAFKPLSVSGLENVTQFGYNGATGIISVYCFGTLCLFVQLAGMPSERALGLSSAALGLQLVLEAVYSERNVSYEMAIVAALYAIIAAGAAYSSDLNRRRLFASLILLSADAQRSQELVNSMLPKCIVNALQAGGAATPEAANNLPQERIVFKPPRLSIWSPASPFVASPGTGRFPLATPDTIEQKVLEKHSHSSLKTFQRKAFGSPKLAAAVEAGAAACRETDGGRSRFASSTDPSRASQCVSTSKRIDAASPIREEKHGDQIHDARVYPFSGRPHSRVSVLAGLGIWARRTAFLTATWLAADAESNVVGNSPAQNSGIVRLELQHEHFLESVEEAERRANRRASVGSILEVASNGSDVLSPPSSRGGQQSIRSPLSPDSVSGRPQHLHWGAGNSHGPASVAYLYEQVSVCFVYVCGIAQLSSTCDPIQLVRALNNLYSAFDTIVRKSGAYKVMAIADMYIIVTGVPEVGDLHHGKRLLDTVAAILQEAQNPVHALEESKLQVKIGLHCGSVAAGVIGMRTRNFHVFGDTVNFASRMCSTGEPGRIHCSKRFKEEIALEDRFIARKYNIVSRGTIPIKGKGLQETFWLESQSTHTRVAASSIVQVDGFDQKMVDEVVHSGSTSAASSNLTSPSSAAGTKNYARSFMSTTLLIENMTNPAMQARRDLVSHLQTAQLRGQAQIEQAVHKASANPSVFRLKSPESTTRQSHLQRADHDHQNFQSLVYVSMEPQKLFSREFLSDRLENLYSAVARRSAWKQFSLLSLIVLSPSVLTAFFAASQAIQAEHGLRIAGHALAATLSVVAALAIALGNVAYYKNWHADFLYEQCVRLLAWSSAISAAGIVLNSISLDVRLAISTLPISLAMVAVTQTVTHSASLLQTETSLLAGWLALMVYEVVTRGVSWLEAVAAATMVCTSLCVAALMGFGKDRAAREGFLTRLHTGTQNRQAKRLLRHMLPSPWHADSIMRGEPVVEFLQNVTLLYSDIVGYTALSARLHPADLIRLLDRLYRSFDAHLDGLGLYKVETIGDAFVVLGGVRRIEGTAESVSANYFSQNAWKSPSRHPGLEAVMLSPAAMDVAYRKADSLAFNDRLAETSAAAESFSSPTVERPNAHSLPDAEEQLLHPTTAVGIFAIRMLDNITECVADLGISFDMRIGIHVGSVVGGIVGTTRPRYFMWGFDTVIGNAMESEGTQGQIMLSNTAASVLKEEGFVLEPGPVVDVQATKIETSFIRSFRGNYVYRHGEQPPQLTSIKRMQAQASRQSCSTAEEFGSAVGLDRYGEEDSEAELGGAPKEGHVGGFASETKQVSMVLAN